MTNSRSADQSAKACGVDPVRLGILWDRLVSICDEIVEVLVRSSFSSIVREGYDASVVLFDRDGRMFAQGNRSIPVFIGTAPTMIRNMLAHFPPETLAPGDVLLTNDPAHGTGHLFDISVLRPVFREGRIEGYVMTITHLPDIGGMGFSAAATESFHEGLFIPVCKLYEAGEPNNFVLDLIRRNVRTPEQVIGDVMANVGAGELGARQVLGFMDGYGVDNLTPVSEAVRGQSETAVRRRLAEMPDGTWHNTVAFEGPQGPLELACAIEKRGDHLEIDFAGSSDCVGIGINVPLCYSRAMALYTVKCLTAPEIPNNEGSALPVTVRAPKGCILNALPPFPTAGRHVVGHFVPPLINGALAEVLPDSVQADSGMGDILTFHGRDAAGRDMVSLYLLSGGFGALRGLDGQATTPGPSNMAVVPVEVWESRTAVTVEAKRLIPDSGGAGQFRGGPGQEVVLRNDTRHPLKVFSMANRWQFPARGLMGGRDGSLRAHAVNGRSVSPTGTCVLAPGDRMTLVQAGGGGIGDPRERGRAAVVEDIARGFVSAQAASAIYGLDD
ncbi:hydantoinase B/oxoprolinase family protein [Rhodobacteraceae bacterium NNCM2]|nr:hydantoinase B/oxoprolinase family protein [Coraliihabitans acroporae]